MTKFKAGDVLVDVEYPRNEWKLDAADAEFCNSTPSIDNEWRLKETAVERQPVCKEWCGKVDIGICLRGDDETCYGDTNPACLCSPGCSTAGRPLNPRVKSWVIAQSKSGPIRPATAAEVEAFRRSQAVKPRTVGTYDSDRQATPIRVMSEDRWQWERMQLGRATGIDRERTVPSRTEVEWRKLPARYRATVDQD